jgi:hypothetical protein
MRLKEMINRSNIKHYQTVGDLVTSFLNLIHEQSWLKCGKCAATGP